MSPSKEDFIQFRTRPLNSCPVTVLTKTLLIFFFVTFIFVCSGDSLLYAERDKCKPC